jgi:hypothetical protein
MYVMMAVRARVSKRKYSFPHREVMNNFAGLFKTKAPYIAALTNEALVYMRVRIHLPLARSHNNFTRWCGVVVSCPARCVCVYSKGRVAAAARALREFYDPLNGHSNKRPPKLYFIAV